MSSDVVFEGIDTVLIRVRNIETSRAWYKEKLGFTEQYADSVEKLVVFDVGGSASLTLWELEKPDKFAASCNSAAIFPIFTVADASMARNELRVRGVEVGELNETGSVKFFSFHDLDGNLLEACQVLRDGAIAGMKDVKMS